MTTTKKRYEPPTLQTLAATDSRALQLRAALAADAAVTMHLLWHGVSLCPTKGIAGAHPGAWPKGHLWIAKDDAGGRQYVNCAACLAAANAQ